MDYQYLNVGSARDLSGSDRVLYRLLEISIGLLSWLTLILMFFYSRFFPVEIAFFIIVFDIYWFFKSIYLSVHLRSHWKKMRHYMSLDWEKRLKNFRYDHLWQMVILPFYKEEEKIISSSMESLLDAKWDKNKMIVVLAYEERAGELAEKNAENVYQNYKDRFGFFIKVKHPKDIPGDLPGKGSNIAYAARVAKEKILDSNNIKYEDVLVSSFDIDTRVYPQYFLCLTWHFLTSEKPYRSSFQPVPFYNNNIWDAPAFSRVIATSGTFWQMIEQERPEQLVTFSSHSMTFKALEEVGYWQRNIVSEDSRIFWRSLLYFNGDYRVEPIAYPVSMDANLGRGFLETVKNVYKQQRRWAWGTAENLAYISFGFLKNKEIPSRIKWRHFLVQLESAWSAATSPLIIFFLGWLPVVLGGETFNRTLLSYNLPRITSYIMTVAMLGLVFSAGISVSLLPSPPPHKKKYHKIFIILQWLLMPIILPVFGSIPNLDAQTRLMLGKYMGFWVTPKHRKDEMILKEETGHFSKGILENKN